MRPLPIDALPGAPSFVLGASLIRGRITPVIDLCRLLLDDSKTRPRRLISISVAPDRFVAVLADDVAGIAARPDADRLPALLEGAAAHAVDTIARLDGELLTILRTGRLVIEAPA